MTGDWIERLARDERKRDEERSRVADAAARKAQLVTVHAQRWLDDLRTTMVRDIETFRQHFPGDTAHEILFEAVRPDGGFVVRKPRYPTAALTVAPHLPAASVSCEYRFTPANGLPPREDRLELVFVSNGGNDDALHIRHHGTGQVFTNAEALSEFLLVPVLTGRPR